MHFLNHLILIEISYNNQYLHVKFKIFVYILLKNLHFYWNMLKYVKMINIYIKNNMLKYTCKIWYICICTFKPAYSYWNMLK